jgi:CRP-like cAMP-binding protein
MAQTSAPRPFASNGVDAPGKTPQNGILSKLPVSELAAIMEHAEETAFTLRQQLFEANDNLDRVFFPLTGMISLVNVLEDGTAIETMTAGREGFVGLSIVNGVSTAGCKGICQVAGNFLAVDAKRFAVVLVKAPDLNRRLHRYSQFAHEVVAQSAACNSVHHIEARCARWLLITSDAVASPTFDLTQEFLSQMLAVRRPGVTVAIGALSRQGLVSHRYGKISILDEEGLRKVSCECYRTIQEKASALLN